MVCESIDIYGEAELALKAVNEFGNGKQKKTMVRGDVKVHVI